MNLRTCMVFLGLAVAAVPPAVHGRAVGDPARRRRAVDQAREVLGARDSVLAHLEAVWPKVAVVRRDGPLVFRVPPDLLWPEGSAYFSMEGETLMAVFRDLANTHRDLFVSVVWENDRPKETVGKLNARRAAGVGSYFFRQCGVPNSRILLRRAASDRTAFRLEFDTRPPAPSGDEELQGVIVNARAPVADFEKDPFFYLDVSLLAPSGIRRWSLRVMSSASGAAVKEYSGTAETWIALKWDGRDDRGRAVAVGEYQAFLTAEAFGAPGMTDSVGFVLKRVPPGKSLGIKTAEPPVSAPEEPRRWALTVHFPKNQSDLAGPAMVELRQLANTLRNFSDEKVVVEGYADLGETQAHRLAGRRAEAVVEALVSQYGFSPERFQSQSQEPRQALEGEGLQKSIAFFLSGGD